MCPSFNPVLSLSDCLHTALLPVPSSEGGPGKIV